MRTNRDIKRMIANREDNNGSSHTNIGEMSSMNQVGNAAYATNDRDNMQKIKALAAQDKKTIEEQ